MKIRIPNTAKIFEFWGPRLGSRATKFYAIYVWTVFAMAPIGLVLFITIAIAAKSDSPVAWAVAYTLIVIAFATVAVMAVAPSLARRAASRTLGVKITIFYAPPRNTIEYEKWRAAYGLEPFGADSSA